VGAEVQLSICELGYVTAGAAAVVLLHTLSVFHASSRQHEHEHEHEHKHEHEHAHELQHEPA
jgi:hypothetical protein